MQRRAELLLRNHDIFSQSEFHVGLTNVLQHRIDIGTNPLISEPLRRHPKTQLDLIDSTVDQLLSAGIVETAIRLSPSNFYVVLCFYGTYDSSVRIRCIKIL